MSTWSIYLLWNGKRTYIGSTTDVTRRLRQHNGELRGGARSTRAYGPWDLVCYVEGFENRSAACRWEKILKMRSRGALHRFLAMMRLTMGHCPKGRQYPVPEGLTLHIIGEE